MSLIISKNKLKKVNILEFDPNFDPNTSTFFEQFLNQIATVEDIFPSWFQVPTASIITTLKYYQAQ
jgi:hypothetical protein